MSVIYEKKGKIAYITINRPQALNACDFATYQKLSEIWIDFRDDPALWIAIITGAGERAFCAGSDIKLNFSLPPTTSDPFESNTQQDVMRGLEIWKPIIAAVNGHANGGGFEIAMGCDIRIASENAMFGLGEVRIGLLPGGGGTQRLPRLLPLGIALEMLFTGKRIDAQEAYRLGLVNKIVPLNQLMDEATRTAEEILASAPLAVRAIKQAALRGLSLPLQEGLKLETHLSRFLRQTEDSREGTRAFAEKRQPVWQVK